MFDGYAILYKDKSNDLVQKTACEPTELGKIIKGMQETGSIIITVNPLTRPF